MQWPCCLFRYSIPSRAAQRPTRREDDRLLRATTVKQGCANSDSREPGFGSRTIFQSLTRGKIQFIKAKNLAGLTRHVSGSERLFTQNRTEMQPNTLRGKERTSASETRRVKTCAPRKTYWRREERKRGRRKVGWQADKQKQAAWEVYAI